MEFDKAYMKQMVKDHEAAVKLFSRQADRDDDADAKAFAAKTLPTLQNHLQMARATYDTVKGSGKTDRTDGGNTNRSDTNMNSNSGDMNMNQNTNRSTNSNNNTNSNMNRNNNTNSNANRNNNTNSNANTNSNVNRR